MNKASSKPTYTPTTNIVITSKRGCMHECVWVCVGFMHACVCACMCVCVHACVCVRRESVLVPLSILGFLPPYVMAASPPCGHAILHMPCGKPRPLLPATLTPPPCHHNAQCISMHILKMTSFQSSRALLKISVLCNLWFKLMHIMGYFLAFLGTLSSE